jgi:hypothetical protein
MTQAVAKQPLMKYLRLIRVRIGTKLAARAPYRGHSSEKWPMRSRTPTILRLKNQHFILRFL